MSDNNGFVTYPINVQYVGGSGSGGTAGPVTGATNFAVSGLLDAQGTATNTLGDLVLSASTGKITISGALNCLGGINAAISASAPTGSTNFFVANQLDARGYLTNSLGGTVTVSGNMQVLGNLIFNSSSLTGSGGATFINSGSYLLTSSFTNTQVVSMVTGTLDTRYAAFGTSGSSGSSFTNSGSYLLTSSFNAYTGSVATQIAAITGSVNASGVLNLPSSGTIQWQGKSSVSSPSDGAIAWQNNTGSFGAQLALTNDGYVRLYNKAGNTYGAFLANNFYAGGNGSAFTSGDGLHAIKLFSNSTQLISMGGSVALSLNDTGSHILSGNLYVSGNIDSPSLDAFTGSTNTTLASLQTFTGSANSTLATHTTQISSLQTYTGSAMGIYDARYVATASFTSPTVVGLVTGTLDTRYAAFGSGGSGSGGATNVFTGSLQLLQSAVPASRAGYGQVYASASALTLANALYFEDARGSITPAAGYDPVYPRIIEEDFYGYNNGNIMTANGLYWPYFNVYGTGTSYGFTPGQTSTAGHPGIGQLSTGTTATGYTELYMNTSAIRAAAGEIDVTWIVQIPTLSDGTNTYSVVVGLGNSATGGSMTQALYFTYSNGTNSGKWQCTTVGTTADSGVTVVAGTWYTLRMILDSTGSNAYFYINGALVGTITTNLPNSTLGPMIYILKSLGTTARTMLVDYFGMKLAGVSRA